MGDEGEGGVWDNVQVSVLGGATCLTEKKSEGLGRRRMSSVLGVPNLRFPLERGTAQAVVAKWRISPIAQERCEG